MLKTLCIALKLCSTLSGTATVIDGDTIIVEGYHIRLNGLDAEELNEQNGPAAKAAMQAFIGNNQITCKLNGERSYNRYVGSCYSGEIDLAEFMITSGYALDCAHYSHGRYRQYEPDYIRKYLRQKPYC